MTDAGEQDPRGTRAATTEADGAAPPVVVGTDGTPTALHAVAWAASEAVLRGRPLRIVHAGPYDVTRELSPGRRRASAVLARAFTVARRHEPRVEAHTQLSGESPVTALVHASADAELLVTQRLAGGQHVVGRGQGITAALDQQRMVLLVVVGVVDQDVEDHAPKHLGAVGGNLCRITPAAQQQGQLGVTRFAGRGAQGHMGR